MQAAEQGFLTIGVGIIRVLRDQVLPWPSMIREWIDNSLGARAKTIIVRRTKDCVEIIDDGDGCEDLFVMESPAKTLKQSHNRASMYGIGGVMSQIHASQGGLVEVVSVHKKAKSEIAINWNVCIEQESFKPVYHSKFEPTLGDATGTKIRIHGAKKFRDVPRMIRDLGHNYSDEIKRGCNIAFQIDGKDYKVEAFKPPPFEEKIPFDFMFQDHRITGFTGIVKPGEPNPYPGWSVHWGYRVAMVTKAPAGEHSPHRIYGEVQLPKSWSNITPTKDDFTSDADDLWEEIGRRCNEVIRRADEQSTDFKLAEASKIAGEMLTGAVAGDRILARGRRSNRGETNGTAEPTGRGKEHRNWATAQDGSKLSRPIGGIGLGRIPSRIRIVWDDSMEDAYSISLGGTRPRTMIIAIDKSTPLLYEFKDDPRKLAGLCCGYIAHELTYNQEFNGIFPTFQRDSYHETYKALLGRVIAPSEAVATVLC